MAKGRGGGGGGRRGGRGGGVARRSLVVESVVGGGGVEDGGKIGDAKSGEKSAAEINEQQKPGNALAETHRRRLFFVLFCLL